MQRYGSFVEAIESLKPTAIIGVSASPGAFDRPAVEAMARSEQRTDRLRRCRTRPPRPSAAPSRPTNGADGRALFASGSPYDALTLHGRKFVPRQGNNSYIFPGVSDWVRSRCARSASATRCSWPRRARWPTR
jgi:malate dehydrogenase (oxaloacetate-decarboxylating)(NADP+)